MTALHEHDCDVVVAMAETLVAPGSNGDAGDLIIAARTRSGDYRTVGGERLGPVRAAIAVAVAAENSRLWADVDGLDVVEQPVRSLPEVVRTPAEAFGLTTAHVGRVHDDSIAALAVWFEIDGRVAAPDRRRETLRLLAAANERQNEHLAERARIASEAARLASASDPDDGERHFDADDPRLDRATGLVTRAEFEQAIDDYDAEEATLVIAVIDDFATLRERYDATTVDGVVRRIADRMVEICRSTDLIARLADDSFAVLFHVATRANGLQVAKRLLDAIARPLELDSGPDAITATIALAHQFGLVDMEELVEAADEAVESGQRAGRGRLVIAS